MLTSKKDSGIYSQDVIVNAMAEFSYMSKEEVTFSSYFRRYKDLYKTDSPNWPDHKKVRLALKKLGAVTKFINYILPKNNKKKKRKKKVT